MSTQQPNTESTPEKLAIVCLVLSFVSFIIPIGIAAVVLGHVSRRRLLGNGRNSKARLLGFAGLVISYIQLSMVCLAVVAAALLWQDFNNRLDPITRAAIIERVRNGDPYKITTENVLRNQQNAVSALRLINDRQREYIAVHPNDGYACELYKIGCGYDSNQCRSVIIASNYHISLHSCSFQEQAHFVATAVPDSEFNDETAASYCTDNSGVIRRYRSTYWIAKIKGECPNNSDGTE